MTHKNKLPYPYKSYLPFLIDQWDFIQELERREKSENMDEFQFTERRRDYNDVTADLYRFDVDYVKARAMEEIMEVFLKIDDLGRMMSLVRRVVSDMNVNPDTDPLSKLVNGLYIKIVRRP